MMPPQKTQNKLDHYNVYQGFPAGSDGKESACNAGDLGSVPGLGRSLGEGNSYPLQYSGLENSMDRGGLQSMGSQRGATFISHYNLYQYILPPPLIKSYKAEISRLKQISSLQKNTCHISMAVTIWCQIRKISFKAPASGVEVINQWIRSHF